MTVSEALAFTGELMTDAASVIWGGQSSSSPWYTPPTSRNWGGGGIIIIDKIKPRFRRTLSSPLDYGDDSSYRFHHTRFCIAMRKQHPDNATMISFRERGIHDNDQLLCKIIQTKMIIMLNNRSFSNGAVKSFDIGQCMRNIKEAKSFIFSTHTKTYSKVTIKTYLKIITKNIIWNTSCSIKLSQFDGRSAWFCVKSFRGSSFF